jgi:hypothetical protein
MKTARIIFICLLLTFMASAALAVVPNYLYMDQQTEKWYKSEGAGKFATLRMHTKVEGHFNGAIIMEREILLNGSVLQSERLLFNKDTAGNINYFGNLDENVLDDPILWVKTPLAIGQTWTDSHPETPGSTDPENMVHYIFAVLDTRTITCPAGTFDCHRVYLSILFPDGQTDSQSFWYNPHCGMVMCSMDNKRVFELQKAIIPGVGTYPDVEYHRSGEGSDVVGLQASPNPLNPRTDISFELNKKARVQLAVYDVSGRLVRTLVAGDVMDPGKRSVTWNGDDERGSPVASGTYIYRLQAGAIEKTNRMTLIR